jgi:hypothetical protein
MATTPPPVPTDPAHTAPPTGTVARGDAKPASAPPPLPPSAVPADGAPGDAAAVVHQIGFFQQPWVQNILPFATSLILHVGLIAIGYAGYKTVEVVYKKVVEEQVIIPDAVLAENGPPGGIVNPGTGGDSSRAAAQNIDDAVSQSQGWAQKPGAQLQASLAGGAGDNSGDTTIGLGSGSFGSKGGKDFGVGGGGDGSGVLAPFGTPGGGGGIGPKAPFAGVGGNARKIVYLCDASGSMQAVFSALRDQLKQSVGNLVQLQFFNVIFFSGDNVIDFNKSGLMIANPDNKTKLYDWVDGIAPKEGTNPIPAIQKAFANNPELIYVLTDGFDQINDFESVYKEFERLNPSKKIKVNCILLTSDATKDQALVKILQRIAESNGGILRVVEKDKF